MLNTQDAPSAMLGALRALPQDAPRAVLGALRALLPQDAPSAVLGALLALPHIPHNSPFKGGPLPFK